MCQNDKIIGPLERFDYSLPSYVDLLNYEHIKSLLPNITKDNIY